MAYTKNTWTDGDIVTSEKLNHMEDGIANAGSLVVGIAWDETLQTSILDKTWREIYDALPFVTVVNSEDVSAQLYYVSEVAIDDRQGGCFVRCFSPSNDQFVFDTYKSSTEDGVLALTTT